jgi:hypothetical protein
MFIMTLKRMARRREIPDMAKIQAAYNDIPDKDVPALDTAMDANGIASNNAFFRECIKAFLIQTKEGELIAWPPEFVLQDRSNTQLVKDRWGKAKDKKP